MTAIDDLFRVSQTWATLVISVVRCFGQILKSAGMIKAACFIVPRSPGGMNPINYDCLQIDSSKFEMTKIFAQHPTPLSSGKVGKA